MKDKEFIQWLRGFVEGVHHYNITPKQWDDLKTKLESVKPHGSYEYQPGDGWTTTVS
jgi:hypothetical protein|tara:strand:+ start:1468 stop:1638 length:171 start_codon:yes stop_codon:yes gene_type:complete